MARYITGIKPLPEPMLTKMSDEIFLGHNKLKEPTESHHVTTVTHKQKSRDIQQCEKIKKNIYRSNIIFIGLKLFFSFTR